MSETRPELFWEESENDPAIVWASRGRWLFQIQRLAEDDFQLVAFYDEEEQFCCRYESQEEATSGALSHLWIRDSRGRFVRRATP